MKYLLTLVLPLMIFFTACESETDNSTDSADIKREKIEEEVKDVKTAVEKYSEAQKDEIISKYKGKLNEADKEIEALKERIAGAAEEEKEELKTSLTKLKANYMALNNRIKELENDSGEAWEKLKSGGEKAFNDLSAAVKKAKNEFAEEEKKK